MKLIMADTRVKTVNFGRGKTGLTTVAFTLYNSGGSATQARGTSGVWEVGTSGIYATEISFPGSWKGIVLWDTGESTKRYAVDVYHYDQFAQSMANSVWDESAPNHLTSNTFGARINTILQRASYSEGYQPVTSIFSKEEKKKIFELLKAIFDRLKQTQQQIKAEEIEEKLDKAAKELSATEKRIIETTDKLLTKPLEQSISIFNDLSKDIAIIDSRLKKQIDTVRDEVAFSRNQQKSTNQNFEILLNDKSLEIINKVVLFNKRIFDLQQVLTNLQLLHKSLFEEFKQHSKSENLRDQILLKSANTKVLEEIANELRSSP